MGKFASDFKAFIAKGNVVDMAVGVVVGGAFNKIVTSLVNDIIMPLVSLLAGGLNVSRMLKPQRKTTRKSECKHGRFVFLCAFYTGI